MEDQRDLIGMPEGVEADEMLARAPMELPEAQWAGMLSALVAVVESKFRRIGLDNETATRLAIAAVMAQGEYAGGRSIYIPRGIRLRNALRDAEIYRRAKRGNIADLAQEYGLTEVSVYRVLREQRDLHLSRVQGRFNFGEQA
ncbi:MAG: Mor transcription activator family protein [Stenotrophomonas sp.]|uniref:Mor transcription activator family protein n=1 Tax=Stenotrophomonas sp. TaxID=69392 RepID=UPI003D6CFCDF